MTIAQEIHVPAGKHNENFFVFLERRHLQRNVESELTTWLDYAAICGVEDLDVHIMATESQPLTLPRTVFLFKSLRSLKFTSQNCTLKSPSHNTFCTIQVLSLISVVIKDDDRFGEWLSSSCTSIKHLYLANILGPKKINITCSSLEIFSITNKEADELSQVIVSAPRLAKLKINGYFTSAAGGKSPTIDAPNLEEFEWHGHAIDHYQAAGKLVNLKMVEIYLLLPSQTRGDSPACVSSLVRVLHDAAITTNKILWLGCSYVQESSELGCLPSLLPTTTSNLEVEDLLVDIKGLDDKNIQQGSPLLTGLSNLKSSSAVFYSCLSN